VKCLREILSLKNTELSVFIFSPEKRGNKCNERLYEIADLSRILGFFYKRSFLKTKCFQKEDASLEFKNTPSLLYPDELNRIKNFNLDFILCFSNENNLNNEILRASKYGVWVFHHGDIRKYGVILPYLWELCKNEETSTVGLYRLSEKPGTHVLIRSATYRINYSSFSNHLDLLHFQSTAMVNEALNDLMNDYADYFRAAPLPAKNVKDLPGNKEILRLSLKIAKKKIESLFKSYFLGEVWNIGFMESCVEDFIEEKINYGIRWLFKPVKGFYFADPCVLEHNGSLFVFFEKFDQHERKGSIYVLDFDGKESQRKMTLSMSAPYHLAYPFVFKDNDEVYMTLEEARSNNINLYQFVAFPDKWEKVATLVENVPGLDPTICRHDNLWWLFFVLKEKGQSVKLYTYYSDHLFGPWKPHKRNPVKADIRSSRPAGKIFYYKGSLVRPAQDCSVSYGGRIVLNRIKKLTPSEFDEEEMNYIEPNFENKNIKGVHTFAHSEEYVFVDGKKQVNTMKKLGRLFY
jgi:hypothetical protein